MTIPWHERHVVPRGVAGEGEKIEMLARQVDRPFKRSLGIADGVVIVQVSKEQLMPGRSRLARVPTEDGRDIGPSEQRRCQRPLMKFAPRGSHR
jgi:hypothetical protein